MSSDTSSTSPATDSRHAPGSGSANAGLKRQRWWRIRRGRLRQEWPWLIWLIVGGVVVWSVSRGRVFERMNGQVEENYQHIAPAQGGRLLKILVKPGDAVEPGGIVAELDPEPWNKQIQGLLMSLAGRRQSDLTSVVRERASITRELNILRETAAADEGRLATLVPSASRAPAAGGNPLLLKQQEALDSRRAEAAEITGRQEVTRAMVTKLESRLAAMDADMSRRQAEADQTAGASFQDAPGTLLALFPAEERIQLQELLDGRDHCRIASSIGGVVDKLVKTPGDYLLAGDHLLEMVGRPKHITAFVSTDEAADLQPGAKVWVTPAHGRKWAVHETTIIRAAPDAERLPLSSKAGSGAYQAGRRITVAFPPSAHASGPDAVAGLLPGEGITVHLAHPGDLSLFRKLSTMAAE
ncbi:MAG: HlyD family efflux transporter periplasmic adaptor subunit [Verrucomicrobiota bacterium]